MDIVKNAIFSYEITAETCKAQFFEKNKGFN